MRLRTILSAFAVVILSSCGRSLENVDLELAEVEPGTFCMGAMPDYRFIKGSDTQVQMLMPGFEISSRPVTQKLWRQVMKGKNDGTDEFPVTQISYKDCQKFLKKLAKLTGKNYFVPKESMWEFAQKSGVINVITDSMEWTSDTFGDSTNEMVVRNAEEREALADYTKKDNVVFRIACLNGKKCPQNIVDMFNGVQTEREHVCSDETIEVNGVKFNMIAVKGGVAVKGATAEQGNYAEEDEKPATFEDVEDYELMQTEVTVGQWLAVTDTIPVGNDRSQPDKPVINVSWFAAQEFIQKLNEKTGRIFRLPTETEWEYAARGGQKSGHYRYAGSNQVGSVAVYADNSKSLKISNIKTMSPNELKFYDMSGNAWEWCIDAYSMYGKKPDNERVKVMRGGSAASKWDGCRVSNRSAIPADNIKATFGFRLAI